MRFLWPILGIFATWWVMARCAGESDASTLSRIAQWRLSQQPVLEIGVASGDPVYELTDAASSLRLDDGGVVIADVGVGELRYFDAAGRFQFSTQGDVAMGRSVRHGRLRQATGEDGSGVAFEGAGHRLVFDERGNLVSEEKRAEPASRIHGRTLLLGGTAETREKAIRAIDLLPAVDSVTGYQVVRLDELGYLWAERRVADPRMRRPWLIYDSLGRLVGRATTPASFEPQHIGADFILGRWRDGHGIDHVRMYGLVREERISAHDDSIPSAIAGRRRDPARHGSAVLALRHSLQHLALLQETHWAKAMRYATDMTALDIELPSGVEVSILSAGVGGWRALAYVYEADALCGIAVGRERIAGWGEGEVVCD
jgi:hypothetical protein